MDVIRKRDLHLEGQLKNTSTTVMVEGCTHAWTIDIAMAMPGYVATAVLLFLWGEYSFLSSQIDTTAFLGDFTVNAYVIPAY